MNEYLFKAMISCIKRNFLYFF